MSFRLVFKSNLEVQPVLVGPSRPLKISALSPRNSGGFLPTVGLVPDLQALKELCKLEGFGTPGQD